jgi:hypothetical protein
MAPRGTSLKCLLEDRTAGRTDGATVSGARRFDPSRLASRPQWVRFALDVRLLVSCKIARRRDGSWTRLTVRPGSTARPGDRSRGPSFIERVMSMRRAEARRDQAAAETRATDEATEIEELRRRVDDLEAASEGLHRGCRGAPSRVICPDGE